MRPEDLDLLSATGRPALTPDGRHAVVAVRPTRPRLRHLHRRAVAGARRRRTRPPADQRAPRHRARDQPGRATRGLPAGRQGGRAPAARHRDSRAASRCALTDHPLGAGAAAWSPDGRRLAYVARVPEPGRYGTEDADGHKPDSDAEAPRLITEPAYRIDDLGFTRDRRAHLFVLDVPEESAVPGEEPPDAPGDPAPAHRRRHRRRGAGVEPGRFEPGVRLRAARHP